MKKVPCWVCKGKGNMDDEEYIEEGCTKPATPCDWCGGDGMIEIGSEQHMKYKRTMPTKSNITLAFIEDNIYENCS